MKVAAIIQARMQSQRLPGKVLQDICGRPLLAWIIARLRRCKCLDEIAMATSNEPSDDILEQFAKSQNLPCIRGPQDDVLQRYLMATKELNASHVVRITGDAPFIDAAHIDSAVKLLVEQEADLVQCNKPLVHEGIDLCSAALLNKISLKTHAPQYREHLLAYAWEHPELANIVQYEPEPYEIGEGYHLSIDNVADLEFTRRVYENLTLLPDNGNNHKLRIQFSNKEYFDIKELLNFLKIHPEIRKINAEVPSNKRRIPRGRNFSVLILVESGDHCGWGHLIRMKQLARELNAYFNCAVFFMAPDNQDSHYLLDYFGLPVQYLPSENGTIQIGDVIENIESNQPFRVLLSPYLERMGLHSEYYTQFQNFDLLIIDRQKRLTEQEAKALKKIARKLVIIDYAVEHLLSEVEAMILPNVHSLHEMSRLSWWKNNQDKCFAGKNFILLRDGFHSASNQNGVKHLFRFTTSKRQNRFLLQNNHRPGFSYLLLNLGATDPFNFLQPLVKKLEIHWPGLIVLMAGSLPESKLKSIAKKPKVLIVRPGSDEELIEWIDGAQLAVSLFGMFCYELWARNKPMLVLPHHSRDCKEAFYFCQECELAQFLPHVNAINPEILQHLSQLKVIDGNLGLKGQYEKKTARTIFNLVADGEKVHH